MAALKMLLDPHKMGMEAEKLEDNLRKRIVGQDAALRHIVDVYQTYLAGMSPAGRPIGNFLFLGPTGSGKTRTVEAVAESLSGDPRAVIKIDCAEYQHGHEIAKLIGSPPGYLGHKETHALLSQEALDQHHTDAVKLSFVLFDEIEKASDALWNLLLGILDKATLTLGDNRRVDFSRSLIFLTSNLGAAEMDSILHPRLGFRLHEPVVAAAQAGRLDSAGTEAARRRFSPEFMNRIDRTVVFNPLGHDELQSILTLELDGVQRRIRLAAGAPDLDCAVTAGAREFLLAEGTDSRYGARHLKRAVERLLVQPVANLIASGQLQAGDSLGVDFDAAVKCLVFSKEAPVVIGSMAA
ncbi:MAG TPA: AAA family ATPase [Candidatus Sulfopaludibacter sp.]|jgi:ATP-dependent Clp protease ATP-binding subunit ClpA|nr:AAA family ATPase [Candidatus Sulfopaludibacter sp.]